MRGKLVAFRDWLAFDWCARPFALICCGGSLFGLFAAYQEMASGNLFWAGLNLAASFVLALIGYNSLMSARRKAARERQTDKK